MSKDREPQPEQLAEAIKAIVSDLRERYPDPLVTETDYVGLALWRSLFLELSDPGKKVRLSEGPDLLPNVLLAFLVAVPDLLIEAGFLIRAEIEALAAAPVNGAVGHTVLNVGGRWRAWSHGWIAEGAGETRGEILRAIFRMRCIPRPAAKDMAVITEAAKEAKVNLEPREIVGRLTPNELFSLAAERIFEAGELPDRLLFCREDGSWVLDRLGVRDLLRTGQAEHRPAARVSLDGTGIELVNREEQAPSEEEIRQREAIEEALRVEADREALAVVREWSNGADKLEAVVARHPNVDAGRVTRCWERLTDRSRRMA
jgi:hypothetical protein